MPEPKEGESQKDFVKRCIPIVMDDGTADDNDQAVAICYSMWKQAHKKFTNEIKALSKTDDEFRVGNYIVLFGGRDLEGYIGKGKNEDGSSGEFFSPQVDLESSYTKSGVLHVDWEHGRGKHVDGEEAPGKDDVLGFVDWKTVKRDDLGVWVERVLNRRNQYMKYLETLIEEGIIGNSVESTEEGMEVKSNGEITRFPLKRDTLTVTPMEPRMITENAIGALKALNFDIESEESKSADSEAQPETEKVAVAEDAGGTSSINLAGEISKQGEAEMDEKEKDVVVEKEELTSEDIQLVEPTIDYDKLSEKIAEKWAAMPGVEKGAPAVMKHAQLGDPDEGKAWLHWIRTGQYTKGTKAYKAALQEGTTTEGGYLVPDDEYGRIIAKRDESSIISRLGVLRITTDRDKYNFPTEDTSLTKFTIVAEEGAISAAEEEPTFGQVQVTVYNFKKLIKVSEELLEDENSGLDQFLTDALGRSLADTENYYALVGTGSSQPQGAFVGGTAGLTLDSASAIGAAEIPELLGKLGEPYVQGAVLAMRRATAFYLRGLTGNNFMFVPTPPSGGSLASADFMLFDVPVISNSNVAAIAASAKTLLYGNFDYMGFVTNRSLRVRRLVELYAGNGQIGILANVRFGCAVLQAEAFQYATHPTA